MSPSAIELPHRPGFNTSGAAPNRPPPSFQKQNVPCPTELTTRSRSLSPSKSASATPVASSFAQAPRSASPVTFSNFQSPRLRYNALRPPKPPKNKSHHPSPSTSPAVTPEPFNKI